MAYKDLDRKQFEYLLSLGTNDVELRRFYTDCRRQLIYLGGKVQNLPHGFKARVQTLGKLPSSTDEVVRAWFAKHVTMVDPEDPEVVIGTYRRFEEIDEKIPEDLARRFARSTLVHIFSEEPPQSLLDFLRSPMGDQVNGAEESDENTDDHSNANPVLEYPPGLPQVLVDLVEGNDADEDLDGLPPELATFISGLQSAYTGKTREARSLLDDISKESALRSLLENYVKEKEATHGYKNKQLYGIKIIDLELFNGFFDYHQDEVLACCTNANNPKAVFVHPMAIIKEGKTQLLTDEKRQEIFPESGDVIAFAGHGRPHQPSRGEIGVWQVEEHSTDKATRFHLKSRRRTVFELRSVPFFSSDYDSVREFLIEYTEKSGGDSLQFPLFRLKDGLIIGARGERPDFSNKEAFDSGLLCWDSLEAIHLEGRLFVLGPLPKELRIYDCASLASTARKLFKRYLGSGDSDGAITKSQIRNLTERLRVQDFSVDDSRIQRMKANLERIAEQQDAFEVVVDEIFKHPNISQRIEQLIRQETERQLEQKSNLQADIERLQKERGEWKERIRKQSEEFRKLPNKVSKAVRVAFEKARDDGMATLAELAIFQAFSAPSQNNHSVNEDHTSRQNPLVNPTVRHLKQAESDPVSVLRAFGVPAKQATALALTGEAVFRAGLMLCVRGVAARPVVEGWAKAIGHRGVLIDSTVGLIDDSIVRDLLAKGPTPEVVALLDANLSALDIYAKPLSDRVIQRTANPSSEQEPAIFLSIADGVGSLPLPRVFERISVLVDLDAYCNFRRESDLGDLMSEVTDPEDGILYERLWRPSADRLCAQIEGLEPENCALVLPVLAMKCSQQRQEGQG